MYLIVNHERELLAQVEEHYTSAVKSLADEHTYFRDTMGPVTTVLEGLPSWKDVSSVLLSGSYLQLILGKKDSALPREIAQAFHAKGEKHAGDQSLVVDFALEDVRLSISNYLPASCHIETVDEWIPAHYGRVNKVVCTGGAPEEDVTPSEVPF